MAHPMIRMLRYLVVAMLVTLTACDQPPPVVSLRSDDLGAYRVQQPAGSIRRLVFAFGTARDAELDAAVRKLVDYGALVARVDVAQFEAPAAVSEILQGRLAEFKVCWEFHYASLSVTW